MSVPRLKSTEFRKEREASWRELERLVDRCERKGTRSLEAAELARLPVLYRATVSSLSVARAISLDRNLVEYLEALSTRAYSSVYGVRRGLASTAREFVLRRFPQTVRAYARPLLLCALFLVLGTVAGAVLTAADPDKFDSFVPREIAGERGPTSSTDDLRRALYDGEHGGILATFATFLFAHNAQVGFMAFALGILVGFPTFVLILSTGLMLGAFVALYASRGLGVDICAWLLPHGIPELTAIVLCGGAGFALAAGWLFPGRASRLESLTRRGQDAGVLVVGAMMLFAYAGLLEGVFRQTIHDVGVRYALAVLSATLVTGWFAWGVGPFRARARPS